MLCLTAQSFKGRHNWRMMDWDKYPKKSSGELEYADDTELRSGHFLSMS